MFWLHQDYTMAQVGVKLALQKVDKKGNINDGKYINCHQSSFSLTLPDSGEWMINRRVEGGWVTNRRILHYTLLTLVQIHAYEIYDGFELKLVECSESLRQKKFITIDCLY